MVMQHRLKESVRYWNLVPDPSCLQYWAKSLIADHGDEGTL